MLAGLWHRWHCCHSRRPCVWSSISCHISPRLVAIAWIWNVPNDPGVKGLVPTLELLGGGGTCERGPGGRSQVPVELPWKGPGILCLPLFIVPGHEVNRSRLPWAPPWFLLQHRPKVSWTETSNAVRQINPSVVNNSLIHVSVLGWNPGPHAGWASPHHWVTSQPHCPFSQSSHISEKIPTPVLLTPFYLLQRYAAFFSKGPEDTYIF
jgi:hypothetical protein